MALYRGCARMDEDGYTYIVQRKKDMIIVSGFNVYPSEAGYSTRILTCWKWR